MKEKKERKIATQQQTALFSAKFFKKSILPKLRREHCILSVHVTKYGQHSEPIRSLLVLYWTGLPFNIRTERSPQLLNWVSLFFIVNGNWGEWAIWSKCSKTCGGGEHSRTRKCDNPAPAHGGKDCEGAFRQRRLCNKDKCPGKT